LYSEFTSPFECDLQLRALFEAKSVDPDLRKRYGVASAVLLQPVYYSKRGGPASHILSTVVSYMAVRERVLIA
jgi:hypothetical protein